VSTSLQSSSDLVEAGRECDDAPARLWVVHRRLRTVKGFPPKAERLAGRPRDSGIDAGAPRRRSAGEHDGLRRRTRLL